MLNGYGLTGQGIFYGGYVGGAVGTTNLVSNVGVVGTDVSGVGTGSSTPGCARFGSTGQAITGFGYSGGYISISHIINSSGVKSFSSFILYIIHLYNFLQTLFFGSFLSRQNSRA